MGADTEAQHIEDDKMRNPQPSESSYSYHQQGHYDREESRVVHRLWPSYQSQRPHHPMKNRWGTDRNSNQTWLPRESMSPGDSFLIVHRGQILGYLYHVCHKVAYRISLVFLRHVGRGKILQ